MKLIWSSHMFMGLFSKSQRPQFSTSFTQALDQMEEEAVVNLHPWQKGWNTHVAPFVKVLQNSGQKGPLRSKEVNSCFQQGLLDEVAWGCVQLNFEHYLGQRFKNLYGNLFEALIMVKNKIHFFISNHVATYIHFLLSCHCTP